MPIDEQKRRRIKDILTKKIREKIGDFSEQEDMNKPFYFNLFSKEIVFTATLLHSIYTWLGGKWEEIAEIVAVDNFQRVERRYKIFGEISPREQASIDSILKDLEQRKSETNIDLVRSELYQSFDRNEKLRKVSETIDLYMEDDGEEYYVELKSVKPNKNEMRAAKRDLLDILAMRQKAKSLEKIHVYLALPYNPYFTGSYRRWTVTKFFKVGEDLLVGKNFWDFIGGENSYEELLGIFEEVGDEAMGLIKSTIRKLERG